MSKKSKKDLRVTSIILPAALAMGLAACGSEKNDGPVNPEPNPEPAVEAAASDVIYQANPRFYAKQEAFKAIEADIPRIAEMGCDILWLMPVNKPGELKAVGSPYCIRDYKDLNPRYGTVADLKKLVSTAHAAGIKVMLDWVANHTSWDHEWISSNPERYAKDANGNITQASTWSDVAQLNYNEPSTGEAMKDAMLYWVAECDIDGYRCDYTEGVPHAFWADAIKALRAKKKDFVMLAESSKFDFYDDDFDMIYDWSLASQLSKTFNGGRPDDYFAKASDTWSKVPEGKTILRYAFNHDVASENNVATMYGSPEGTLAAYTLTAMFGGLPMIYSSMDVDGLSGKQSFFDYRPLTFSQTKSDAFKAINKAYKESAELRNGTLKTYSDPSVAIFTRTVGSRNLLVMVNTTDKEATAKVPIAVAGSAMTDLISGGNVSLGASMTLKPYQYLIFMN